MALYIRPITPPAVIARVQNGRIPDSELRQIRGSKGCRLLIPAARAWDAMATAAARDGVHLDPFWPSNAYRPYTDQERIFRQRYLPGIPSLIDRTGRVWNGRRWYRHFGASAAVPGTSNHGWGLAVDVNAVTGGGRLAWLEANALRFGWSWELLPEEPWHIRYVAGDRIPRAVVDHETSDPSTPAPDAPEDEMTPDQEKKLDRVLALVAEIRDPALTVNQRTIDIENRLRELRDPVLTVNQRAIDIENLCREAVRLSALASGDVNVDVNDLAAKIAGHLIQQLAPKGG